MDDDDDETAGVIASTSHANEAALIVALRNAAPGLLDYVDELEKFRDDFIVRQNEAWNRDGGGLDKAIAADIELHSRIDELEAALSDAIDGLDEILPYVSDYFRNKWDLDDYAVRARTALAKGEGT